MDTPQLIHRLQLLQHRLCQMADDLGTLTDPEILAVSEQADRLIVQLQRHQMEQAEERKKFGVLSGTVLAAPQPAEEIGQKKAALFLEHT